MRKQYMAQFTRNETPDKWENATKYATGRRYDQSREEAQKSLEYIIRKFPDKAHMETVAGFVGVITDASTAHRIAVNKTRIVMREVTEWEEV